jgi:hypothetical protein
MTCTSCPTGFASLGGTATCFNTTVPQAVSASTNTTQMTSAAGITVSPTLTLAPPPAINTTVVDSLPFNSNTFITSKNKLQSFKIVQSILTASFQIYFLDHTTLDSIKTLSIDNVNGQWSYVQSSSDSLSCIIVKSASRFMALSLNSAAGTFTTYANLSILDIPTSVLSSSITVGDNCNLIMSGSTIYSLGSSGLNFLKAFSNIKAYSSSLNFIIDGNSLYGYANSSYVSTTLDTFSSFTINNNLPNNMIICGYNATGTSTFSIQQNIFFVIFSSNRFNIFNKIQLSSTNNQVNSIPVMVSP